MGAEHITRCLSRINAIYSRPILLQHIIVWFFFFFKRAAKFIRGTHVSMENEARDSLLRPPCRRLRASTSDAVMPRPSMDGARSGRVSLVGH